MKVRTIYGKKGIRRVFSAMIQKEMCARAGASTDGKVALRINNQIFLMDAPTARQLCDALLRAADTGKMEAAGLSAESAREYARFLLGIRDEVDLSMCMIEAGTPERLPHISSNTAGGRA